jgi:hypothetical protein
VIQTPASTPGPAPSPQPVSGGGEAAAAAPGLAQAPVPTPSLKPGEVITWIKIERPRLELGQVLVGSFVLVGITMAIAVSLGILLGQFRSRGEKTHGTGGLDLR